MSRWVRIQADVFEHPLFPREPFTEAQAWVWLITKVAWKDTKHRVGSSVVDVPLGSMFITLRELQATWRWKSDKRVRSFLARLEREAMIETETDAGKTQVTICNYSRYQEAGRTEDAAGTQDGRKTDALKTPIHQYTSISDANASSSPEPAEVAPVQSPVVIDLPCVSGENYPVRETDVSEWEPAFPAVDIRQQLAVMRSWLNANQTRRKTRKGMRRFIVSWLERKQNSAPSQAPSPRATAPPQQDRKPRNAGELARMQIKAMQDAPDNETRHFLQSDRNADHSGTGIARRFALPAGG